MTDITITIKQEPPVPRAILISDDNLITVPTHYRSTISKRTIRTIGHVAIFLAVIVIAIIMGFIQARKPGLWVWKIMPAVSFLLGYVSMLPIAWDIIDWWEDVYVPGYRRIVDASNADTGAEELIDPACALRRRASLLLPAYDWITESDLENTVHGDIEFLDDERHARRHLNTVPIHWWSAKDGTRHDGRVDMWGPDKVLIIDDYGKPVTPDMMGKRSW